MIGDDESPGLLSDRSFVLFWLTRVLSTLGMQMQAVAVGWQLYLLTGSPLDLGLLGLVQFLPSVALVLITGPVADRFDRRRVTAIAQFVGALAVGMLALSAWKGTLTREVIFSVAFVIGIARAFEAPALTSLLPTIVAPSLFPRAVAGSASANQIASISGPAIGGIVYAFSPLFAYSAASALYMIGAVLVSGIVKSSGPKRQREPLSVASLFAGFAFVWRQPIILGALSLDMFAVLVGGVTALLPIFARDVLQTDSAGLGLLRSCPGVGALLMSLILARWPLRRHVGRTMLASVALFGLATMVFSLSRWLPLSMFALAALGAFDLVSVVIRHTLIQVETPDAMRGRVSAVNTLFINGSVQIGDFRAGTMAHLIGAVPAVVIGAASTLLVVAIWARLFRPLVNIDEMPTTK